MNWIRVIAGVVVLAAGIGVAVSRDGEPQPVAPPLAFGKLFGGPFELVDHDGMVRTDKDYRGRFALIYFGYTSCPDICPTSLQEMAAALDELGETAAEIQPLFISIDPKRDTPMVLKDFVSQFGDRFVGLSGSEGEIARLAKSYRLHRVKVVPEWSTSDNDYLVDHSSLTFLLGPDGMVLTLFPHNTPGSTMAMRLRDYLNANSGG